MYSIEIERPTTKELFEAAAGYGFTKMQFDFSSVCDEQMPETIDRNRGGERNLQSDSS